MSNYETIKGKLNEVVLLTKGIISESQCEFIHSYIISGEWALALETLCDILIEDELSIPKKAYNLLEEAGEIMLLPKETWEPLQTIVEP